MNTVKSHEELIEKIEYKDNRPFGIPKIMFPYLDLYLLQTLIYFVIKKKDEINERELVRFIMFWMVNIDFTKKSSESSKEVIKFIDKDKNLIDIYEELTKDKIDSKNLFFKLIPFEHKEVKPTNLVNPNERALNYFGEKYKELYQKFSTNTTLLLWIQREVILKDEMMSKYEPLAIHNEENVPYDFDHLMPQSN